MIRVTALVDNNAYNKKKVQIQAGQSHTVSSRKKFSLCQEFGLSLFIEADDQSILFDTGAEGGFLDNADALNIPVRQARTVILSHGHRDHCGYKGGSGSIFQRYAQQCTCRNGIKEFHKTRRS